MYSTSNTSSRTVSTTNGDIIIVSTIYDPSVSVTNATKLGYVKGRGNSSDEHWASAWIAKSTSSYVNTVDMKAGIMVIRPVIS